MDWAKMTKLPKQNIIAIIYDFDGTLTPYSMQEYTVFKDLGIDKSSKFWSEVERESKENEEDIHLLWMRKIKELATARNYPITPKLLASKAKQIKYFPGVKDFFKRINGYVRKTSGGKMEVRHYIVSSGLKEILEGISIKSEFYNIFGSEYHYNAKTGQPDFPKVIITDTIKTQYIFRINKGKEKISESINSHMPENERPVPFKNIIYIGDGLSDVPAMNVTKKNGGYAVAVYRPNDIKGKKTCIELLNANRVNFVSPADYRKAKRLTKTVELIIDTISQRYTFETYG